MIGFGPAVTSATQTVLNASDVEQPKLYRSLVQVTLQCIFKWMPLETRRDKYVCKLVRKHLTNNFFWSYFVIISPLTGMSFIGSRDGVIVFLARQSGLSHQKNLFYNEALSYG